MSAIGIDLGTTYSCVASLRNGKIEIIANDDGNRVTPSYVSFNDEQRLVGDAAKQQISSNAENTLYQIKRLIGCKYNDEAVQRDLGRWSFQVVEDENNPKIMVQYKKERKFFIPEEVSAMVLTRMKETAEAFIGTKVTDAVITVPAYFNDAQRKATKDAGTIAGLNVIGMINEPTAAAIAYGLESKTTGQKIVLIFDLGGGTFDVTVMKIEGSVFEVQATGGDTHLGGEDFTNALYEHFSSEFNRKNKVDMKKKLRSVVRLRKECERVKRALSTSTTDNMQVDALYNGIDFTSSLTRSKFEIMNEELFLKTIETVKSTIKDAGLSKNQIDDIVLVGGSTRIPKIRELLEDYFEKDLLKTINADEAVAHGAAVQAAILSGDASSLIKDVELHDVAPLSLGIETRDSDMVVIIPRNSRIPIKKYYLFVTGYDDQTSVDFRVYEGERACTEDNHHLGTSKVENLPALPKGKVKFLVCLELDKAGILTVTARDKATGNTNNIVINQGCGSLSSEEVKRLISNAEKYKKDDENFRKRSKFMNDLENYAYNSKKTIEREVKKGNLENDAEKDEVINECVKLMEWLRINEISATKNMASIGIDFGTSKACVAVCRGKQVDVIANEHDSRTTPCYIGFGDDEIHIGETAKGKALVNMKNTVHHIKRLMGCKVDDENITQVINTSGFDMIKLGNIPFAKVNFHFKERRFRAEEVSAMIIRKMKEIAENHLQTPVTRATISVPACFNDAQRTAVMNAGKIAGLTNVSLINEPTAAAIAFNLNNEKIPYQLYLVFDLGANSIDVSVCERNGAQLTVKSSCGNSFFGGIDFDTILFEFFKKKIDFRKRERFNDNKKALIKLQYECEKAKRMLSKANQASIQVDCLYDDEDFISSITREEFEDRSQLLFNHIQITVKTALKDAGVESRMIEQVVLVGGSTRIPGVRKTLIKIFGESKLNKTVNADEAVAIGAAVFAEQNARTDHDQIVCDIISQSIGLEYNHRRSRIIKTNSQIPCQYDIANILTRKGKFKVYEKRNDSRNLIQEYSLTRDYISKIILHVDENGLTTIQPDEYIVASTASSTMLNSQQIEDMKKIAEHLKNENNDWIERNSAKNDLEKLIYTEKQKLKSSKTKDKRVVICDETLKWIENTPSATAQEYQDITEKLTKLLRKSKEVATVKQNTPIDRDQEEKRNAARYEYLTLIRQTREKALKLEKEDFVYNECTESERWLEDHMKEDRDVYLSKHREFEFKWKQLTQIHQSPVAAKTPRLTHSAHSSENRKRSTTLSQTYTPTHGSTNSGYRTQSSSFAKTPIPTHGSPSSGYQTPSAYLAQTSMQTRDAQSSRYQKSYTPLPQTYTTPTHGSTNSEYRTHSSSHAKTPTQTHGSPSSGYQTHSASLAQTPTQTLDAQSSRYQKSHTPLPQTRTPTHGAYSSGNKKRSTSSAQTSMRTHRSGYPTQSTGLAQKSNPLTRQQEDLHLLRKYKDNVLKSPRVQMLSLKEKLKEIFDYYENNILFYPNFSDSSLKNMQKEIDSLFWRNGTSIPRHDDRWLNY